MSLGANFYTKLAQIASEVGMKPEDILAIMVSESGLDPAAHEEKFNGGGLIGFMPQTLQNLGFKGSPEDFRKLNGEAQLEYVKRNIENNVRFNGGPFTSAAQYYVANFFPVALKLPGIKNGNESTPFIEEHPETIRDPKTGKMYSKKYYNIGYHIDPTFERAAYKANPLFHGKQAGAITYGDMVRQVNKNKKNPLYAQAMKALRNGQDFYEPKSKHLPQEISFIDKAKDFFSKLQDTVQHFAFAAEKNTFLISIASSNKITSAEYAKLLSTALNEYLQAETKICQEDNEIEVECKIIGDKKKIYAAIKEFSKSLASALKENINENVYPMVYANLTSKYDEIEPEILDIYDRQFKLARRK